MRACYVALLLCSCAALCVGEEAGVAVRQARLGGFLDVSWAVEEGGGAVRFEASASASAASLGALALQLSAGHLSTAYVAWLDAGGVAHVAAHALTADGDLLSCATQEPLVSPSVHVSPFGTLHFAFTRQLAPVGRAGCPTADLRGSGLADVSLRALLFSSAPSSADPFPAFAATSTQNARLLPSPTARRRLQAAPMSGMATSFFTAPTGWGSLLFARARIDTRGAFAGAVILSFLFAAVTTAALPPSRRVEARGCDAGAGARAAGLGALSVCLRTGCHYISMLLVMSYSVGVIVAVIGGHGFGYLAAAVAVQAGWWAPAAQAAGAGGGENSERAMIGRGVPSEETPQSCCAAENGAAAGVRTACDCA